MSEEDPTPNLKRLVFYVCTVYAPTWFDIKHNPNFVNGPDHLLREVVRLRGLNEDEQEVNLKFFCSQIVYFVTVHKLN